MFTYNIWTSTVNMRLFNSNSHLGHSTFNATFYSNIQLVNWDMQYEYSIETFSSNIRIELSTFNLNIQLERSLKTFNSNIQFDHLTRTFNSNFQLEHSIRTFNSNIQFEHSLFEHAIRTFNSNIQFEHSIQIFNPNNEQSFSVFQHIYYSPRSAVSFHKLDRSSSDIKMASRMTVQYILSVVESAIASIDRVKDTDDISSLVLRLDYLNRVIVGEGLPDPIVSSLGEVLSILREKEMEPDWEISSTDFEPIRR